MLRQTAHLRAAAGLVEQDLRTAFGPAWSCVLEDGLVLTVTDGIRTERSMLPAEVSDESWYVNSAWSGSEQQAVLESEALEVVALEVQEILDVLDRVRLACPEHRGDLEACTHVWYCREGHDVALVGRLGGRDPWGTSGDAGP